MKSKTLNSIIMVLLLAIMFACSDGSTGSGEGDASTAQNSTTADQILITANYLSADRIKYYNTSLAEVKTDLFLPSTHESGTSINWSIIPISYIPANQDLRQNIVANNIMDDITSAVGNGGTVARPAFSTGDINLQLIADIRFNNDSLAKKFDITVIRKPQTNSQLALEVVDMLQDLGIKDWILRDNTDFNNILHDLNFGLNNYSGTNITWSSDNQGFISDTGIVTRPSYTEGNQTVMVNALVSIEDISMPANFTFTVIKLPASVDEAVAEAKMEMLSEIFPNGEDQTGITKNINLPTSGLNNTEITWESSDPDTIDLNGNVSRPEFGEMDKTVTLTGIVTKEGVVSTVVVVVTVKQTPANDVEAVKTDRQQLNAETLLSNNDSQTSVENHLNLPTGGANYTQIEWVSDNPNLISNSGHVTRPLYSEGDQTVTMTSTVKRGDETETLTFTFTVKALPPNDAEAVEMSREKTTIESILGDNSSANMITDHLNLVQEGSNQTIINWESSNPSLISETGTVTRPSYTDGDQVVVLTGTIMKGEEEVKIEYTVTIPELPPTDFELVNLDKKAISLKSILGLNYSATNVIYDLSLPQQGSNGSTINWESSNAPLISGSGSITRPSYFQGDQEVLVVATIQKGDAIAEIQYTLTLVALPPNDEEAVAIDKAAINGLLILAENTTLSQVMSDLNLPQAGANGTVINWVSDYPDVLQNTGTVNRPFATQGNQTLSLTAAISRGNAVETVAFQLTVLALPPNDTEAVRFDKTTISLASILGVNESASNITEDLTLPQIGSNGTSITWIALNNDQVSTFISSSGKVNRPTYSESDQSVTLTGLVKKGLVEDAVVFNVIILALPPTDEESILVDIGNLTLTTILADNNSASTIISDLNFPQLGANSTQIIWSTDHPDIITTTGKVYRPAHTEVEMNPTIRITAKVSKGDFSREIDYDVTVIKLPLGDLETALENKRRITVHELLGENQAANDIQVDLLLPQTGSNGAQFTWSSSNPVYISNAGYVVRPAFDDIHQDVTLTLWIWKNNASATLTFDFTVSKLAPNAQESVVMDKAHLTLDRILGELNTVDNVQFDLVFDQVGQNGTQITWSTSDENIVTKSGKVNPPAYFDIDVTVAIKATITKDQYFEEITHFVTITWQAPNDTEAVTLAKLALDYSDILRSGDVASNVQNDLNLVQNGLWETKITWTSSDTTVVSTTGGVNRPGYLEGNQTIVLNATISRGEMAVISDFTLTISALAPSDTNAVQLAWNDLVFDGALLLENTDLNQIKSSLFLPQSGRNETEISWASSVPETISDTGAVIRNSYQDGNVKVILTATIKKNEAEKLKFFELIVIRKAQTVEEAVYAAMESLTEAIILNSQPGDQVEKQLNLPQFGENSTVIKWESSNTDIVTVTGKVSRPPYDENDQVVTLIAVISKDNFELSKAFLITVLREPPDDEDAVEAAKQGLTFEVIKNLNTDRSAVIGDLILPKFGLNESEITWRSNKLEVISDAGTVTRDGHQGKDIKVNLKATITKGSAKVVKTFIIKVLKNSHYQN